MIDSPNTWLSSLVVATPQAGFELAIKLTRMGVKYTQPSDTVRKELRPSHERAAEALIASSSVIAVHFQTVAAANSWRRA